MIDSDQTQQLQQQVEQAAASKTRLNIQAGGSKLFLGVVTEQNTLSLAEHCGVISYEPTELVITVRAGTPLSEIEKTLSEHGQTLAFEPPSFAPQATIGGTVACALAGPAQPYRGGVRDHILGCKVINGGAKLMRFGGEVMKNVAGYDVSRLMTGAMGTLGVLTEISLKVIPKPEYETTVVSEPENAISEMQTLAGLGLPVTASACVDGTMYVRISGTETTAQAAAKKLKGNINHDKNIIWQQLREQTHTFFNNTQPLWRISVPALTNPLALEGNCLYDWAGMQRWLHT